MSKQIKLSQEDYEFLKDLQHELLTQENDGNADPVFWGVEETVEECRGDSGDFGGDPYITYDDGAWDVVEAIETIEEEFKEWPDEYNEDIRKEWESIDKTCAEDICEFIINTLNWDNVYGVVYSEKVQRVTPFTGAFLTKRACKNYIEKYGYNHKDPHTYAMTAYRNFELAKLISILKELKFEEE
jgi:hypothetical protein